MIPFDLNRSLSISPQGRLLFTAAPDPAMELAPAPADCPYNPYNPTAPKGALVFAKSPSLLDVEGGERARGERRDYTIEGVLPTEVVMLWAVRGTTPQNEDYTIVIEAESKAEAEYRVMKRGLPVVFVEEATDGDVKQAKLEKKLWKYHPDPVRTAFGRKINQFQLACLMVCGLMTLVVILHNNRVPLRLWF